MLAADELTVGNRQSRPIQALTGSPYVFYTYASPQYSMYACKHSILSIQDAAATAAVNVGHQGHDMVEAANAGLMLPNFVQS